MAIHVLTEETINQIAAGEVIERPSSVVKELVENAIDAGATAVTVEIKEGGISFIRITDNGSGIDPEDIRLAFVAHATSKIQTADDLIGVSSLGFRGEALASIAAIAQVEMMTRKADALGGMRYRIEGGKEIGLEDVGVPVGTTFVVRNLFYNTPVRRKFLKSAQTEAGYIAALIERIALSHPDISFRFINNGQNRLMTSGNNNLKDIIYSVYGRDITQNLIPVEAKTQEIQISGFVGKPSVCRGSRSYENYFINGRYIKSNTITKAIEDAYKGYIMLHNFPFTALNFRINSTMVDVNVHPQKRELRFSNGEMIYAFVLDTIRKAVEGRNLIPEVSVDTKQTRELNAASTAQAAESRSVTAFSAEKTRIPEPFEQHASDAAIEAMEREAETVRTSSDSKGLFGYSSRTNKHHYGSGFVPKGLNNKYLPEVLQAEEQEANKEQPDGLQTEQALAVEEETSYGASDTLDVKKSEQMNLFDEGAAEHVEKAPEYRVIGQLFDTYWLIEFEDKFYMCDQHAAHEKVMFERIMKQYRERKPSTQLIMPAIVLNLSLQQEHLIKEHMDLFTALGYEIEEFGSGAIKVTGVPAELPKNLDLKQLLVDVIDGLEQDGTGTDAVTMRIASMSCKAAVKGNSKMSFKEAEYLIRELMTLENPYNCPHGRPTMIVMTQYELEKKFKRIV